MGDSGRISRLFRKFAPKYTHMLKTYYRHFLLTLLLALLPCLPARAVLTGANMEQTLSMLHSELTAFSHSVDSIVAVFSTQRERYLRNLQAINEEAEQVALMFYSQQDSYVFGQAYSAEKASDVLRRFDRLRAPADAWIVQYDKNIKGCEKLCLTLETLDKERLSAKSRADVQMSLQTLRGTLKLLRDKRQLIINDRKAFLEVAQRMDILKKDVATNYKSIHSRVFFASDRSYNEVLANFGQEWRECRGNIYFLFHPSSYGWEYREQWAHDGSIVLWTMFLSFVLSFIFFYSLHKFSSRHGYKPRVFLMPRAFGYTCACITTTLVLLLLRTLVISNPFYQSVISLTVEVAILCIVVFLSVSVRLPRELVYPSMGSYLPSLYMTVCTLTMRMMLADAEAMRFLLVPIIVVGLALQLLFNYRNRQRIERFDKVLNEVSAIIYISSLVMAWVGRYFLAVQTIIIWTILLTGLMFLSFAFHSIERYTALCQARGEHYHDSYKDLTLRLFVKPCLFILTLGVCLYECAHIFNIVEWMESMVSAYFIDFPGKIRVSLLRVATIVVMAMATNYVMQMIHHAQNKRRSLSGNHTTSLGMMMQLVTTVVWGVFIIFSLFVLEVNGVGILAVMSGVMVGVGIALRDTIDSFLCGVSMMMGRVKIGDYVMCENVRGRVVDIQYRTTQIETEDGAIVSFFNTAFFGKNYRNLTGKHRYERMLLPFKLQKDADITHLREVFIQELLEQLPEISRNPGPRIHFVASERFHMELMAEVWVPVDDYLRISSRVKEIIFLSIRHHGLANMMPDVRTRVIQDRRRR